MSTEIAGEHKVATSYIRGEGRLMGLAYLLVALPLVLLLSYLNPPFQSPDEPNHAFRAWPAATSSGPAPPLSGPAGPFLPTP